MKVFKGQSVIVKDSRKGTYRGVATADFDTIDDEWYSVTPKETVYSISTCWEPGDDVPCRRGIAYIQAERAENIMK